MNNSASRRAPIIILGALLSITILVGAFLRWVRPAPQSPSSLFQTGLAAMENKDRSTLLEVCELLEGFPEYRQHSHLLRAAYAVTGESPDIALRELGKIKPEAELREPALMIAGEAYYKLGQLGDAHRLFSTVVEDRPGHVDAHRWLSAIAYDLGAYDEAMAELDIVSTREPNDFRPYYLKGQMLMDTERFAAAQEAFVKALENQPSEQVRSEIIVKLAQVQLKQRDYAGASGTLSRAEQSAMVLKLKGECERGIGHADLARRYVDDALRHDPSSAESFALSGVLFLDAGQPEQAIDHLRKALKIDPHDYESRYQLAQALREIGQTDAADEQANISAKTVEIRLDLAKKTDEAIRNSRDPEVRERIADLCDELGKRELAMMWRKAAAGCRPRINPGAP